jgi:hypothetical protein
MSPRPEHFAKRSAFLIYVGRIREFTRVDWAVYIRGSG